MNVITQVFAVLAGLFQVFAFVLESVLFRQPKVRQLFLGHADVTPDVFLLAFNQGFYNLFVAAGVFGGLIAYHAGQATVGRALTLYACAFTLGAGIVLVVSDRRRWRGALGQAVAPLIALLAAMA
jgi:putative membrane protein